jgi:hypothetical protein
MNLNSGGAPSAPGHGPEPESGAAWERSVGSGLCLSLAFKRGCCRLAGHVTIRGKSEVKEHVFQNVVSTSLTEKSEVFRERLFNGSTTAGTKAVMVCLTPHVLDATRLSDFFSIEYVVEMSVETAISVREDVYRYFIAYNS